MCLGQAGLRLAVRRNADLITCNTAAPSVDMHAQDFMCLVSLGLR